MLADGLNMKALLLYYVAQLWTRRWVIIAIAWMITVIGCFYVSTLPDRYTATAQVYVDTDTLLTPLMKGLAVQSDVEAQIDIMRRTLLSRPNMQELMRMTDLDLQVSNAVEEEDMLARLQSQVRVTAQGRQLFNIQYSSVDPQLAQRVVQALLNIFVEQNIGNNRRDIEESRRFIDTQIGEYERRLRDAETQVADFRRENATELNRIDSAAGGLQRLETELRTLEFELQSSIWQRDQLRIELARTPAVLTSSAAQAAQAGRPPSAAEQRLDDLRRQLDDALLRYTERHPDVIGLQRRIATAEADVEREGGPVNGAGGRTVTVPNPARAEIERQVASLDLTIGSLEQRLSLTKQAAEEAARLVASVPAVQLQLQQLNRDYEVLRANYDELISRRESARLVQDLEDQTRSLDFRVVDPPRVPAQPSGPNRLLFLIGILIVAGGAGAGIAFLQIQLKDSFTTTSQLRDTFGVPVLGAVSMVSNGLKSRFRLVELSAFVCSVAGLVAVFGGLIYIYQFTTLRPDIIGITGALVDRLQLAGQTFL